MSEGEDRRSAAASSIARSQELRSRVAAFLPKIEEANKALSSEDAGFEITSDSDEDADGETETTGAKQYIQLELGLGVYEEKKPQNRTGVEGAPSIPVETKNDTQDSSLNVLRGGAQQAGMHEKKVQVLDESS